MARLKYREKALELRIKQKLSYSQIKKILKVSKGTLSYWLKDYPLPEEQIRKLRDFNQQRIERCRETKRKKKEKRLKELYKEQKKIVLPLSDRESFIAGLMLYWGEGAKSKMHSLSISNTDPSVLKFFIHWLNKNLSVSKTKMKVQLHLYNDMDINKEMSYWSNILKIPLRQFIRPYIKKTSAKRINHKGGFGHGTCNVRIGNTRLTEKIFMGIKAISDRYQ